jgi:hypothetical protein
MADSRDLFSMEELAKLGHQPRWLTRGAGGRVVPGRRPAKPDYEGDLAFLLRTQERPPICMPQAARQYRWALELQRNFCADFAYPVQRVLVEVQGGIWRPGGGAHSGGAAIERDIEKAQYAARLGWAWVPVTQKDISSGHALLVVQSVLERLGWRPGAK